jgi:transposase
MKFIQGNDRTQTHLFPVSLDQAIDADNEVRFIELFVESLPLADYGFNMEFVENGRPAYHPGDLLKLFIYGYMNKVRTTRDLEKECKRNIEVMWLMRCLQPDHNTIANFRRDNPKAIKKVFRATVQIARHFKLIGGRLVAGDSTKLQAQNSKKNNFSQKKIERNIAYIDQKLDEYCKSLAEADGDERDQIRREIDINQQRKDQYRQIAQQMKESGATQVSTSDPESRLLVTGNKGPEVVYNVQVTTDAEHCLPIDYKVTNSNDNRAMGNMLRRAKSILRTNEFTALYDKGYHTGSELETGQKLGIETLVAIPEASEFCQPPDALFSAENFAYSTDRDSYTCPQGAELLTNGTWYTKRGLQFKQYKTKACRTCPVKNLCTTAVQNGRMIQRGEFALSVERNKANILQKRLLYKRRKAIVEHPFGTIKRQWGFDYILTKKGMERASADVGFMFTAYNLRRIINIIGQKNLKEYLKRLLFPVFYPCLSLWRQVEHFIKPEKEYRSNFSEWKCIFPKPFFAVYFPGISRIAKGF